MRKLMVLIAAGIFVLGLSAPASAEPCMAPDGFTGSCYSPIFYAEGQEAVFEGTKGTKWQADDACEGGDKIRVRWKCAGKAVKKLAWTSDPGLHLCICDTPPPPVSPPSAHGPYTIDQRKGKCNKNKLRWVKVKLVKAGPYGLPVQTYLRIKAKEPWEQTQGNRDACDF